MKEPRLRVGIFGGSFNPVHKGHVRIAKLALSKLRLDKLIIVPAYQSPDKAKSSYIYAPAADRVKMLQIAMPPRAEVSEYEVNRHEVSYTHQTIRHFRKLYPAAQLFFIIGSDLIASFDKWEHAAHIAREANLVMFQRTHGEQKHPNVEKFFVQVVRNGRMPYSSTLFRQGEFNVTPPKVRKYIGANLLYPEILPRLFNDVPRLEHVYGVAELSKKLAQSLKLDLKSVHFSALNHDITKTWTEEEHRAFLAKLRIKHEKYDRFELHAQTAYYYLRRIYKVTDLDVLNAVRKHTTLARSLSHYDKVLFAADKLEGNMHNLKYAAIYHVLMRDFDAGFRMLVRQYYAELTSHVKVDARFAKIYRRWM